MTASRTYRVAEVAAIAGVTVRTLHHYDEIDLLPPSDRSRAGYRLYTDADLLRLQQILIQRELGLALEQIRKFLHDPAFDLHAALLSQKAALEVRATHTRAMLDAVDVALSKLAATNYQSPEERRTMQGLFLGFNPEPHEDEARKRWGNGDGTVDSTGVAYAESKRRTKSYTRDDWQRFATEQIDVYRDLASLLSSGIDPADAAAQAAVERHRLLIERWFYTRAARINTLTWRRYTKRTHGSSKTSIWHRANTSSRRGHSHQSRALSPGDQRFTHTPIAVRAPR